MNWPCARNDYAGSTANWLHHHLPGCAECGQTPPVEFKPGYKVSACGRVWGNGKTRGRAYREMKLTPGRAGYLWAQIRVKGKNTKVCVHRLVAQAFLTKLDPSHQVRHLNGDKLDNTVRNLRWGSVKENAADRDLHGRTARGERNGWSRHTDDQVAEALRLLASGMSQRAVASLMGTSQSTVWRWAHGRRRTS